MKDLQDCEEKCPKPAEGPKEDTPTPGPKDDGGGGGGQVQPPPKPNIEIPKPPDCFDTQEDKDAFIEKLENEKKKWSATLAGIIKNGAGTKEDLANAAQCRANISALDDAITNADKNVQICKKGGGAAKTPTPGKGKPKRAPRVGTGRNICFPTDGMAVAIIGTGETIGHIADVRIDNLSDQSINCSIPAMVLESGSGKNQDYVVPHDQEVALRPHESKIVPVDGICVNRHKPPVGKGIGGDLVMHDPGGNVPQDAHSHLKHHDADKLLKICKGKYDTVDKLQKDGAFKDFPYRDKEKQKEIALQWSTWSDPRISEIEGGNPATKDDLKKVVEKQVGKVPRDEKKKIDKGIDAIWDKIELTNDKAKDYEEPEETTEGSEDEYTPPNQPEYVGQGQTYAKKPTPTPTPKQKSGGGKTKDKPTPTPTPTPKPKDGGGKTKDKPTPTPTPTPEPYVDPPDVGKLPPASYPYSKKIDCGDISITINKDGAIIFDFTPNGKCPCKEFGWIQHFRSYPGDPNLPNWHYDNGTQPGVSHGGSGTGVISHPDKANQPTKKPDDTEWNDWTDNPYYGGPPSDEEGEKGFGKHPTPQTKIGDKPTWPNQTYRTQLVCIDTGEVLFTWAWGPFEQGNENPGKVGGKEIGPPPNKK
ncbi:MAG TPA: hypothetical protein VH170_02265 [Chthoniobacterales bacterium]|nr:hypothetical protein [Chthoniobacterales bacterium]